MKKEGRLIIVLIVIGVLYWVLVGVGGWLGLKPAQTPSTPQRIDNLTDQRQELALIEGNTLVGVSSVYYPKTYTLGVIMAEKLEKMFDCESTGVHDQWGDLDYKYPAYGIAQFQERTFYWLAGLAEQELDWKNEADQRWLSGWALENGYGYLWSCYKIIQ